MKAIPVWFALAVGASGLASAAHAQKPLDENEHYRTFQSWAIDTQMPDPVPNMFKFCIDAYNKMIASGVAPTTRVPEGEVRGVMWKGTVQEITEKWCDAGLRKTSGEMADRHAPYKTHLKADKLRLVVDETHGHVHSYALPGGKYTDDAKLLPTRRCGSSMSARRATNGSTAQMAASVRSCAATPLMRNTMSLRRSRTSTAAILPHRRTSNRTSRRVGYPLRTKQRVSLTNAPFQCGRTVVSSDSIGSGESSYR